jgi:xylulokinase
VEQEPDQWREVLLDSLRELGRQGGIASQVQAVTCSATLSGLICLGEGGEVLRPAVMYADRRPASQIARIEALEGFHRLTERSGWRVYSGDFLPQLAWLRAEMPGVYQRSAMLLDATGFLNYLLTGSATLDRYTAFTCYADPAAGELPGTLFRQLDISVSKLGRLVSPGESIGPVLSEIAALGGLGAAKVVSVSYDSAAAYLGGSLHETGEALDISGTVTSFGVVSGRQIVDRARRVYSIPHGDRGKWIVRGSTALAGGALEWARQTIMNDDFEAFDEAVASSAPGANGVVFLPYLSGARSPVWEPSASGVFYGLTSQSTRADMARAVYEGLCYSLRHIIQVAEECGAHVDSIQLGGGLSRNSLLNRMKADITGKTVIPLADAEVTTIGAASIAARSLGWFDEETATRSLITPQEYVEPDPGLREEYDRQFNRYLGLIDCLLPLFIQDRDVAVESDSCQEPA